MAEEPEDDPDETDPLRHADIGETVRLRKSKTLHSINYTPSEFFGSDRIPGDIEIASVEVVDGDGTAEDIRITWEGDVTKRLPRNWDYHAEPVTEEEKRRARLRKWGRRIASAIATIVPLGVAFFISTNVVNSLAGEMTINGEPMTPPSPESMAITFGVIIGLAAIIMYGLRGGFPGKANTGMYR